MKNLEKLVLLGGISSLLIGLPLLNLKAVILFSLSYLFFVYGPFIFLVNNLELDIVEKFFLLNIAGLSYALIYVVLDVFLKIPLTRLLFVTVTLLIYIISYYLSKRDKQIQKNTKK